MWRPPAEDAAPRPQAAVAHGPASRALLARLGGLPPTQREGLQLTAAEDWLVVLGNTAVVPWVDGVRYAAPSPRVTTLWLPTHATLDLDPELVWRALRRRYPRSPLLLWPSPEIVLPLDRAQPADDATLRLLAARWEVELTVAAEPAVADPSP
ncbi:hypothetical protein ABE85_15780 [Mitsuaria sp. 7]|nr:hypothetical protein ABE85_15780 [Mitsuaria sp. 7]